MARTSHLCILGESGLLGSALLNRAHRSSANLTTLNSHSLAAALRGGTTDEIERAVAGHSGPQDWIYAAGIIDPRSSAEQLNFVNAEVPLLLHKLLTRLAAILGREPESLRLVTFGSVLEERAGIAAVNPYIRSKVNLYNNFSRRKSAASSGAGWAHVRLHTLYGLRRPPPFMFLGQMEAALRTQTPFAMSAGQQLREYHHAEDVADNVLHYLSGGPTDGSMITLDSGRPVRIGSLAADVFEHFGVTHLLKIGAVEAQSGEVFAASARRSPYVTADRDATSGIIAWLTDIGVPRSGA